MDHLLADSRILSAPYTVEWAGFRSTTTRLQQCGWQLSAEQLLYEQRCRLAMHHRECRLYAITQAVDVDYLARHRPSESVVFSVRYMAPSIEVLRIADDLSAFSPIDAMPQIAEHFAPRRIEDFNIFAAPLTRTEEIIVEPKDVMQMLDLIKRMQAPEQTEIRQRAAKRDLREQYEAGPRQRFHAQILSFDREAA